MIQIEPKLKSISSSKCLLGEGLSLDAPTGKIAWVDIDAGHTFLSNTELTKEQQFDGLKNPSKTFFDKYGNLMVLHQDGISELNQAENDFVMKFRWPFEMIDLRFNDAAILDSEHFVVTTMSTVLGQKLGKLWHWSAFENPVCLVSNLEIPNSVVYDQDLKRLYFSDSASQTTSYLCKEDEASYKGPFLHSRDGNGLPDGSALDSRGNLWNCRWDASSIAIINQTGNLVGNIKLPTIRPTSCQIDENKNLLIVTSAIHHTNEYDGHTLVYDLPLVL